MFENNNIGRFGGMDIVESTLCMGTWQLNEFTKELMGDEWVKQFDRWAEHALPMQPTMYIIGGSKIVAHPLLVDEIRRTINGAI